MMTNRSIFFTPGTNQENFHQSQTQQASEKLTQTVCLRNGQTLSLIDLLSKKTRQSVSISILCSSALFALVFEKKEKIARKKTSSSSIDLDWAFVIRFFRRFSRPSAENLWFWYVCECFHLCPCGKLGKIFTRVSCGSGKKNSEIVPTQKYKRKNLPRFAAAKCVVPRECQVRSTRVPPVWTGGGKTTPQIADFCCCKYPCLLPGASFLPGGSGSGDCVRFRTAEPPLE